MENDSAKFKNGKFILTFYIAIFHFYIYILHLVEPALFSEEHN